VIEIVELSKWVDEANAHKDPEAATWGRLAKVCEEAGEVIRAYIGVTGQNPRKGVQETIFDVREELLDVALTALCAYEHLTGNQGSSMPHFTAFVKRRHRRALG
jgi:NTP pyrophosphatase (non-canonical NTP hydrolase)